MKYGHIAILSVKYIHGILGFFVKFVGIWLKLVVVT